jgi:hypothetical protein
LEGKRARGLRLLIEAHGWMGEAEEAPGKAVSRSAPAWTKNRRGRRRKKKRRQVGPPCQRH